MFPRKKETKVRFAMLALTSYEQSNGFSVVTADELYFINGGSCAHPGLEAAGNYLISVG